MYTILTKQNTGDAEAMSRFINTHPNGHFLQSPQWAQVKRQWDWRGVVVRGDDGRILGAASLLIRRLPLGLSLIYAPRGPICDRDDPAVLRELLDGIRQAARECRAPLLLLDPDAPADDDSFRAALTAEGFMEKYSAGLDNIQAQHVFRLDLSGRTEAEVFAAFPSKTRYNIRLAQRRGVTIRQYRGDRPIPAAELSAFSRLMEITGERDRFLTRDRSYFQDVLSSMGENAVLYLAYLNGKPIAGTIEVFYGHKAWYLYGASSNEHRAAMPNYLLQWEMIRRALRLGCSFYDLRGVPQAPREDDPLYGLYRFKKGFGGEKRDFTGLFIKKYRPLTGVAMLAAMRLYRRLKLHKLKAPSLPLREEPAAVIPKKLPLAG